MHVSPVFNSRIHQSPIYRSLPGVGGGEVRTGAVKFDGTNDYIVTASSPLSPAAGDFSACAWVKFTGVATQQVILSQLDGTGTGRTWLELTAGAKLQSAIGNSNLTGATSLVAGNWYHVAITMSGTTETLYLNGASDATGTRTAEAASGVARIGTSKAGANYMSGCVDDVRIYNVALSAGQVAALYANTTPAPTTGLVGHWKLDEGTGTSAADSSGNGNNGTLNNGPTWEVQVPPRLSRNRLTEDWSVAFDGNDDYIVAATTGINFANPYSISFWYKYNVSTAGMGLLSVATDGSVSATPNILIQSNSNTLRTYDPVNGYHDVAPTVAGQWYHVVVTRSPTQETVYVNGVNTSSSTCGTNNNTAYLYIGSGYYARTNGNIKDVRVYNSALAQSDITKLCNGQESTAVPVAQWRLNDGSGTTATDSIGSNHGTLTNGPTWSSQVPPWFVA